MNSVTFHKITIQKPQYLAQFSHHQMNTDSSGYALVEDWNSTGSFLTAHLHNYNRFHFEIPPAKVLSAENVLEPPDGGAISEYWANYPGSVVSLCFPYFKLNSLGAPLTVLQSKLSNPFRSISAQTSTRPSSIAKIVLCEMDSVKGDGCCLFPFICYISKNYIDFVFSVAKHYVASFMCLTKNMKRLIRK